MTDDLVTWLRAQLDEDERLARAAFSDAGHWSANGSRFIVDQPDDGEWRRGTLAMDDRRVEGIGITLYDEGGHDEDQAAFIAEHDPARVLREVEAKRRIIEEHPYAGAGKCETCDLDRDWPCPTLRLLALPYADRSGYREEWRPDAVTA